MRSHDSRRPDGAFRRLAAVLSVLFVAVAVAVAPSRPTPGLSGTGLAAPVPADLIAAAPPPVPQLDEIVTPTPMPIQPPAEFITYTSAAGSVRANELGRIPILMYHGFVHNDANTDEWTLTYDQFREQLDWLVANDFVMVGLNSIIHRDIAIPAGKKPVVLTFDDASSGQYRLQRGKDGGFEVNPDTAVGILEEYKARYPEFAGPAFFAVLSFNCFTRDDDPSTCEDRLTWLVDHGYEIGNHTENHQNLSNVSLERFKQEIIEPTAWFAERVSGPNNLSDVLVLPFGAHPKDSDQERLLYEGFWYLGEQFVPRLVIEVSGGPTRAPYDVDWSVDQTRYNTHPDVFWYWADQMTSGATDIYVSDGSAETVTVPEGWIDGLDQDRIRADGRRIIVQMTKAGS
jgi:peptidoglycan/xylan/chitin deacetylase (PgdA/CDA1 family)